MQYSPCGNWLAVGSHDNNIYIFNSYASCEYVLKGHNSFIVNLDWSADSRYIRSNCGAHEILYWSWGDNGFAQDKNGRSNTKGTDWATKHTKFGWCVDGIFPPGTDGTHVNGVSGSHDGSLIVTGDDFGLVNIFRDPCRNGSKPLSLRGHSEHVVRVDFSPDDSYIFSVGGYDQTLMQWKRC
jgi:WD40 repeat protein